MLWFENLVENNIYVKVVRGSTKAGGRAAKSVLCYKKGNYLGLTFNALSAGCALISTVSSSQVFFNSSLLLGAFGDKVSNFDSPSLMVFNMIA